MTTIRLDEHGPQDRGFRLSEADGGNRRRILIISPGWGSSGYYPADVLERDAPTAFPTGTHLYVDHPSNFEAIDRANVGRSIRDLAAILESDGEWDADGPEGPGVYATARITEAYDSLIEDLAPHIGVSVRGSGLAETGEAEGRRGRIISRLHTCESVDFVARAGRGGKVLAVMESARLAEALTANELRDRLERELTDEDAEEYAWVRDWSSDDGWVVFGRDQRTWRASFTVDGDKVTVADDAVEVEVRTDYVPVDAVTEALTEARARLAEARNVGGWFEAHIHRDFTMAADDAYANGRLTRDERIAMSGAVGAALDAFTGDLEANAPHLYDRDPYAEPDPETAPSATATQEGSMPTIEELTSRVEALEAERNTAITERDTAVAERDEVRGELSTIRATEAATTEARRILSESDAQLPTPAVDRVIRDVVRDLPLTESGQLDTAAFTTRVTEAATAEATYLGVAATPAARVVGLGEGKPAGGNTGEGPTDEELQEAEDGVLTAFGVPAKTA